MIYQGKFADINDKYIYYVKVGNTGVTREIQDNAVPIVGYAGEILCFAGESPVTISSDMSDTFEHVYIRSCSINLISNYDIRKYVVANNYNDIPVEVRMAEIGVDDTNPVGQWLIIFSGFVNPLSFNQPFAQQFNEFTLECTDKLGILEYKKLYDLLGGNYNYNTPQYFLNLALSVCGFSSINYNVSNDFTDSTLINPIIFVGEDTDNQDNWMTCLDVIEEIGKVYGCYIWQDRDYCCIENVLIKDLTNSHLVTQDDYVSDNANISVDEAYNKITCTVDISNADEDFINPFDKDVMTPTTRRPERILTEIMVKGKDKDQWDEFRGACVAAEGRDANYNPDEFDGVHDWSAISQNYVYKDVEAYDHYAQILQSSLLDFGEHSYLTDGGGTASSGALTTLNWLKANPGKGALVKLASTDNLNNTESTDAISLSDLKPSLIIQIGGHTKQTQDEIDRIEDQIYDNRPVCSFKLNTSSNLIPNDVSSTNWLIISGTIKLNPIVPKTGPVYDPSNDYERSLNTIKECNDAWQSITYWDKLYIYGRDQTLYSTTTHVDPADTESDQYYYQNYSWTQEADGYDPDPTGFPAGPYYWPYNQSKNTNVASMFIPELKLKRQKFKWQGSFYNKDEASEIDNISRIPILACEFTIGTGNNKKYLCEDLDVVSSYSMETPNKQVLLQMYSWYTQAEVDTLVSQGHNINNYFTLPVDPDIGKYMIGEELNIQNTCSIDLGIDAKGFAIPIPANVGVTGEVNFKILGPINTVWDDIGYDRSGILWWREYWTTHNYYPLLSYVENIFVNDLEFKVIPDNGGYQQLNDDNDLTYYSEETGNRYISEQDFDCKFCTSLTTNQINELGVDYKLNNSAILNTNNTPWYGMDVYPDDGQSHNTPDDDKIKLEEARVIEQYDIWKVPRNIIELSLKIAEPDKCYYKQPYTFNYLDGTYQTTARDIDLKQNNMTCTMKDFT